jgi:maltooligosyltrehalose trehalohydrolase
LIDDPELPKVGIFPLDECSAQWRIWAPRAERVELVLIGGLGDQRFPMRAEPRGFFSIETALPEPGQRYAYALDGEEPRPDPCARWQPEGIHRPSAVWFPERLVWNDRDWRGVERQDLVFYELHVGTFTPEGTFEAIIPRLNALRDLGITAIELMPIGQFPGARSWGYDGVFPFAPQNSYGGPHGLHRLIEACHQRGLAVFLDVIDNHFGPEGNVFPRFGHYFDERFKTDWGPALNYSGLHADPVRALVIENARYWIRDYHFDGLRLDAADQIYDQSPRHILAEIAAAVHAEGDRLGRIVHVFAETDLNDAARFLGPQERGGYALDGHWNDDFHHAAHVVLTGETSGYYLDFAAGPRALAKALERVFVNDGNYSPFRDRRHGAPATEFSGDRFLIFTQNHDQVGNRLKSDRYDALLAPSAVRLAAGILLLAPRLPLLFMGQEYGETNPFPFFCDFEDPQLIEAVRQGRKAEFAHFRWDGEPPDPVAPSTRDLAVLSWSWEEPRRRGLRRLYRDLLQLRRTHPTLRDFHHGRARLLGEGDPPRVLELIRGGVGAEPTPELRIVFNLGDQPQTLPPELVVPNLSFRSEMPHYGAAEIPSSSPSTLQPHEFIIFGPIGSD